MTVRGTEYFVFTKVLWMPSLKRRVRIAAVHDREHFSHPPRLLVTNRLHWDTANLVQASNVSSQMTNSLRR